MLKFGQTHSFLFDFSFDVLEFVDRLRVSEKILAIDIGGNPLLLWFGIGNEIRVLGMSNWDGMWLIAMGNQRLVVLGLNIGQFGHQNYGLLILLLRTIIFI